MSMKGILRVVTNLIIPLLKYRSSDLVRFRFPLLGRVASAVDEEHSYEVYLDIIDDTVNGQPMTMNEVIYEIKGDAVCSDFSRELEEYVYKCSGGDTWGPA
ncbi:hypothetical protein MMC21_005852 [Puttea exsequens]|nr:hypothetical protein [Puttea exsequens]